ncbi:MAG: tripartite tricarboxylate transporter TctB family protein [Anaerovoracaceae bacterium]
MEKKTKPGEKIFPVLLLMLGLFVTRDSYRMYQNAPELQGYGTVPLFCGIAVTLLAVVIIFSNFFKKSELAGCSPKEKLLAVIRHLFSFDVMVMTAMILAYCIALGLGAPFIAASPVFLWASMSFLGRGNLVKNLIYTLIVMVFVILVFKVGFSVVLP